MMRFDAIVSIHIRHDVICFKLGKAYKMSDDESDVVIPWIALASSRSKNLTSLNLSETILSILIYNIPISHHDEILDKFILVLTILSNLFIFLLAFPTIFFTFFYFFILSSLFEYVLTCPYSLWCNLIRSYHFLSDMT